MKLRNKKRIVAKLLIFCLLFLVIGCSPRVDKTTDGEESPVNITFIGSVAAGPLSMIINAISECVNKSYPGSIVTIVPGNSITNPSRINKNEADVSVTHNVTAYAAMKGNPPFKEKNDNIAAIASLYPSVLQIAVDKKAGLTSFDEFINQKMKLKISIGQPSSNNYILFNQIIAEYGITIDDIHAWGGEIVYQTIDNSTQMMADGTIDGAVLSSMVPIPNLLEASTGKDFVILKVDQQVLKNLTEKYNYQLTTIPADSYPFLKEDIQTVCSRTVIVVPANSPDEMAYKIALSITENLDYLQKVHVSLAGLTPESMVNNLGIQLHPGAEKYYREKAIIK